MSISLFGLCDFDKGIEMITEAHKDRVNECKELRKKLREFNKDDRIQELEAEIKRIRACSLQNLSEQEQKDAAEFRKAHYASCKNSGRFWYELAGTGIGTAITIKCPICEEEKNITDYGSW